MMNDLSDPQDGLIASASMASSLGGVGIVYRLQ